ncbi:phosphatase PAP2 family protein [uncultured Treponema sp.]|uniref:phosphatase PAP2 family protein n=1 Tax=uncultured Treponema sp. TaxID=162155 RepID=UPI0025E3F710|nr:phosphatase PAP2 family protein [uncultured Treponema sp.]
MKLRFSVAARFFSLFLMILLIFPLSAEEKSSEQAFNFWGSGKVFALNPVKDGLLLGAGVALSGSDLILDNVLEVNRQKYDGRLYDKDDVNSLDRIFMHSYSKSRDRAADLLLVAGMASPCVLAATEKEEWLTCFVMYSETLLIANGIKELTKLAVNRTRPYMYYDADTFPEDDVDDGDWANSFPSGHSTMAFAGATFASYTFCKYFPDSAWKIPLVAGTYSMAGGVAALRLSSGNHFLTDVLTGAVIGTSVGFLVPWLHTFNAAHDDLNVSILPNGVSIAVNF